MKKMLALLVLLSLLGCGAVTTSNNTSVATKSNKENVKQETKEEKEEVKQEVEYIIIDKDNYSKYEKMLEKNEEKQRKYAVLFEKKVYRRVYYHTGSQAIVFELANVNESKLKKYGEVYAMFNNRFERLFIIPIYEELNGVPAGKCKFVSGATVRPAFIKEINKKAEKKEFTDLHNIFNRTCFLVAKELDITTEIAGSEYEYVIKYKEENSKEMKRYVYSYPAKIILATAIMGTLKYEELFKSMKVIEE